MCDRHRMGPEPTPHMFRHRGNGDNSPRARHAMRKGAGVQTWGRAEKKEAAAQPPGGEGRRGPGVDRDAPRGGALRASRLRAAGAGGFGPARGPPASFRGRAPSERRRQPRGRRRRAGFLRAGPRRRRRGGAAAPAGRGPGGRPQAVETRHRAAEAAETRASRGQTPAQTKPRGKAGAERGRREASRHQRGGAGEARAPPRRSSRLGEERQRQRASPPGRFGAARPLQDVKGKAAIKSGGGEAGVMAKGEKGGRPAGAPSALAGSVKASEGPEPNARE